MKNHPPRREIPEWSPRVEFEVTEVELKVEEVELNEENWLRILRENGGRMDFSKLLKHFRDIRGAQNKALVRSLRDRWCDEPVKVGKKHFIGLKQ